MTLFHLQHLPRNTVKSFRDAVHDILDEINTAVARCEHNAKISEARRSAQRLHRAREDNTAASSTNTGASWSFTIGA